MATLHDGNGHTKGNRLGSHQDGQVTTIKGRFFPDIDSNKATELEIRMNLPGLGMRTFSGFTHTPLLKETR